MTTVPSRDPAHSIPAFLATCCETNPRFSESVRSLGQAWGRWLLLQRFPTSMRRQYGERWLIARLVEQHGFVRVRASGNRMKVKGLALREGRFAPPLPDPARTTISLLAGTVSLPESVQAHIPLAGATVNKRPPSTEIVRRFLAACCDVVPASAQQPGESRLALRRRSTVESLTRCAHALRAWLAQEGASPSLLRFCSAQWLRRELAQIGKECRVGTAGYTLVCGLTLLPPWSSTERSHRLRRDDSGRAIHRKLSSDEVRARHHVYNNRLNQRALERLTGKPTRVPVPDTLPDDSAAPARRLREEKREALQQHATTYLKEALIRDVVAALPLPDLLSGFHNYLLNRNFFFRRAALLKEVVLAALDARGMRVERGRPSKVIGWRFRTPADTR